MPADDRNETDGRVATQPFLDDQLRRLTAPGGFLRPTPLSESVLKRKLTVSRITPTVDPKALLDAVNRVKPDTQVPVSRLPDEVRESLEALSPRTRSFHGTKLSLGYFRQSGLRSPCANRFGYLSRRQVRTRTALPFDASTQDLLTRLGQQMGTPLSTPPGDTPIPAGFTYAGQFIDHDITLDASSSLDVQTHAPDIHNLRTPVLDLDSVYGDGPAQQPYLYRTPSSGNPTAIKLRIGTNTQDSPGGSGGAAGPGGMQLHPDFDLPRTLPPDHTALIGDPRNDENLIVSQFHHAVLRLHNAVVDMLVLSGFTGDIFVEARKVVTQHYQWAVVHDFLPRICGQAAVDDALNTLQVGVGSPFRMPVEFSVAAYRFGHSMIRDNYWVNFNFPNATLGEIFAFNRVPQLPVRSSWVVDFNAFFETGVSVPVFNFTQKIDSNLANGLNRLPGMSGMMAVLAIRNLLRGLAFGLPSGQGMARQFGISPMTRAQLKQGLPQAEIDVLEEERGLLLRRTPLWYYVLREAAVLENGDQLGPVGARIVAETFIRMLRRDQDSYLNAQGFAPFLPSATAGDFTFADLVTFAGVIRT